MIIFALLVLLTWILQRKKYKVPKLVYKFVDSFGIALVLDFILIIIVDLIRRVSMRCKR
jgi:hypothetical protein